MMSKYIKYILLFLGAVSFTGCDDYVDIRTEGELIPETTENYRYLLNNTGVFNISYPLTDAAPDDIVIRDDHARYYEDVLADYNRAFLRSYTWADSIYIGLEEDYPLNNMYIALYNANVVIDEVVNSTGGTEADRLALEGEAKVHRAYTLLELVNIFGPAYNPATASEDLAAPLFTEPVTSGEISRATVQEFYEVIVSDLNDAINSGMPATTSGREVAYPSQASAHAILARAYLYMGNYDGALAQAELALGLKNDLFNLADYQDVSYFEFPQKQNDIELILSKQSLRTYRYTPAVLSLSDDLLNTFDTLDLRYRIFTQDNEEFTDGDFSLGRSFCKEALTGEARNSGPTVPEMMLIQAECLARNGDAAGAMTVINDLRRSRFTAEDYSELTADSNEETLIQVLAERRRELMGRGGFRWFDLKRLNTEPRFAKTITHRYLDETFVLEPGDDRYRFPFAPILFSFAPDLEPNR